MSDTHPDVQAALAMARGLRDRLAALTEDINGVLGNETSPRGYAQASVDAMSRLTSLRLLNNATTQLSGTELATEILASITASSKAARSAYDAIMNRGDLFDADDTEEA